MIRAFFTALIISIITSPIAANASTLFLSGDSNIGNALNSTYTTPNEGNKVWFKNILGSGTTARIQNEFNASGNSINLSAEAINEYYNSLAGVTSSPFSGTITNQDLDGVDLFISMVPRNHYTPSETAALTGYLARGGNLFLLGDGQGNFTASNAYINSLLTALNSSMRLGKASLSSSFHTTVNIDADPFNNGVNAFKYAYTNTVSGGTSLLRTIDTDSAQTFVAYEVIPEPATGALLVAGLACSLIRTRKAD